MKIVGLTGGIGSGKSAAADFFSSLGVPVIDTDAIAHQMTGVNGFANASIGVAFGAEMLESTGQMARSKMRALVFNDVQARKKLEAILHPLIRDAVGNQIAALPVGTAYAVLVVPLLFERMTFSTMLWRSVAVDCTIATQIKRVIARSHLASDEILRIIGAQIGRQQRLQLADDLVCNQADIAHLRDAVGSLNMSYLKLLKGNALSETKVRNGAETGA